jgi:cytochrome P450
MLRTFKTGMTLLVLGAFPTWTAKEAIQSLDIGSSAFEAYFKKNSHRQGSALVRARYEHSIEHQVPLNDIARSEFSSGVALLANTVPTTFWMLFHIYSDSEVLAHCRAELSSVVVRSTGKEGGHINTIDMSKVKTSCPMFLSTFKEVLRLHSTSVSARLVMEDHMLDDQYMLKKGSTVMMPGPVQHTFEDIWGPNVDVFDYKRFTILEKCRHSAAFRAFGGGTTLCSGRHFATTEILAFTAVMILRFDVKPKKGNWKQPSEGRVEFWEATASPDEDIVVKICPTSGKGSGDEWAFTLSDLDQPIELSAEDLHTK